MGGVCVPTLLYCCDVDGRMFDGGGGFFFSPDYVCTLLLFWGGVTELGLFDLEWCERKCFASSWEPPAVSSAGGRGTKHGAPSPLPWTIMCQYPPPPPRRPLYL